MNNIRVDFENSAHKTNLSMEQRQAFTAFVNEALSPIKEQYLEQNGYVVHDDTPDLNDPNKIPNLYFRCDSKELRIKAEELFKAALKRP